MQERLTPYQILCHPYFHDLNSSEMKEHTDRIPHLFDFNRLRVPRNGKEILHLQEIYMSPMRPVIKGGHQVGEDERLETGDCTPQQLELGKQ